MRPDAERRDELRDLRDIREALRSHEDAVLSGVAERLAGATERLLEVSRRLEDSGGWVGHEEAASYLGISPDALYRAVASGEIPRDRIYGNVYRYSKREMERAIAARRPKPQQIVESA